MERKMKGIAIIIPIITRRIVDAIQPTIQVKTAFPLEKSRACLTATTMDTNCQIDTAKETNPPKMGIKLRIISTPGELEKPIVLRSSPNEAVPPKTFVPTK
jgi:hypothetical protein